MLKVGFNQERFFKWLERELVAVLAVGIVGLGSLWTLAGGSATVTMSLQVLPAGGLIEVLSPNGGESWEIGSVHNITWSGLGDITDVKIELQRAVAGAWETIINTTTNDGSYPWTVTLPATTTATIRISKVGEESNNDSSDGVFNIVTPSTGGGGGGGYSVWPAIDNVVPSTVINNVATLVDVTGFNFDSGIKVRLNNVNMSQVQWLSSTRFQFTIPAGIPVGTYSVTVEDSAGRTTVWGSWIWVKAPSTVPIEPGKPVPTPPINLYYSSRLVNQSTQSLTLTPGQETIVWADFYNNGTLPWDNFGKNPTRLGTSNPRDRLSVFKATWFSGWILKNRPANVSHVDQPAGGKQTVNPGETGRFTFKLKAPSRSGKYVESFGSVVEFRQWMQEGAVKWNITVASPTSTYRAPVTAPTTGTQVVPVPSQPETTTTFYDGMETWLRYFSSLFSWLVSGF